MIEPVFIAVFLSFLLGTIAVSLLIQVAVDVLGVLLEMIDDLFKK